MSFLDSEGLDYFAKKLQSLFVSRENLEGVVKSVNNESPDNKGNVDLSKKQYRWAAGQIITAEDNPNELEGGEIKLELPKKSTLNGGYIKVDVLGESLRIFEEGLPNRGVAFDLKKMKSLHTVPVIISSYVNGRTMYRVWSNGFKECWGYNNQGNQDAIITLPITFDNVGQMVLLVSPEISKTYDQTIGVVLSTNQIKISYINGTPTAYYYVAGF